MSQLSKFLFLAGALLILIAILLTISDRINWLGKLPGDIIIKKKNFTFYFPLATSILISLFLSLLILLWNKFK